MEERAKKKTNKTGRLVLLLLIAALVILGIFFACNATKGKSVPIVYEKDGMLYVKPVGKAEPFTVSEKYAGGQTMLFNDGKSLLFTDAAGALCHTSIKNAKSAAKTAVLSDNVFRFFVAGKHIYYIKDEVLYENNLKGEKQLATGVQELVVTQDERFVFFNTATDLFGMDTEAGSAPRRIAEGVSVYDLLHTALDWKLDSEHLYYISGGRFAHLNEDLTETVLCENAAIGFVLDGAVYAVTETQIDEDAFKLSLLRFDGDEPTQIATDLLGTEAVSQVYNDKTTMLFTKPSETKAEGESYYTLDTKGKFRYLCENENYTNLFASADGKRVYMQTENGELFEYKLTGKGLLNEKSKKQIASGVQNAYAVKDHLGVSADLQFGIYHNNKYEPIYDDGMPHYPKLLVEDGKAYVCDQSGTAPFYICKGGKLREVDTGVTSYALLADTCIAYLKANETNADTWDLYKIDNNKKPVLVDTAITALHESGR